MTLEQLRIFVAVAELEHVTRAAQRLNLTQSAVSAAVAVLESRYATRLFDRVGRRIALTEAGSIFLGEARAVLARAALAEAALVDLAGLKRGVLALAASQTIGNYFLPKFIHDFRELYPGVDLRLSFGNSQMAAAATREGAVDIGFVETQIDDPALAAEAVAEDQLLLVVAPFHALAQRAPKASDLQTARFVCRESGSGTREMFEAALPGLGLETDQIDCALTLPSNEAVRAAAAAGAGVAALSLLVAEDALKAGTLVALDIPLPKRMFTALRLKERHETVAARAFLQHLRTGAARSFALSFSESGARRRPVDS